MTGQPFAAAAVVYAELGWSAFPLPSGRKAPPPAGLTGRAGRDATSADVAGWLATQPEANIGLRMPAGVVALDVDEHDERHGAATIAVLEAELGPLPPTFVCSARPWPAGHRYYRVPEHVELVDSAGPNVDVIQRHHRYAVVWPSTHPETGSVYQWCDPDGVLCAPPAPEDLPELPAAWVDKLRTDRPAQPAPAQEPAGPTFSAPDPTGPAAIVARHRAELPGGRHDATVRAVAALARAASRGQPGALAAFDAVREQFRTAVEREPGGRGPGDWQREWVRMVAGAEQLVHRTPDEPEHLEAAGGVAGLVDWSELWASPEPGEDFIARPLLARGRSHAVYAGAKSGKSLLMLDVAAALAAGRSVLGQAPAPPVCVLYLDFEMTAADLRERLDSMGYGPADDLSRFAYYLLPTLPPLDTPAGGAKLAELVERHRPELVVVDTTGRAVAGPENDADTIRGFYRHSGSMLKRAGCTVVRLDHAGKDAERGQRGTSAKVDDVDVVWRLTPADGSVRLTATHRRVSWVPQSVTLRLDEDPLRHVQSAWSYKTGAADLGRRLDDLGVPLDGNRTAARAALAEVGVKCRNEVLSDALRWRRDRAGLGSGADR